MLFPTRDAIARAMDLQYRTRVSEGDSDTLVDDRAVSIATIHGRQDLVLIYSMLTDQHRQLVTISRGVWVLALIGLALLARP